MELAEDARNIVTAIESALGSALGLALDVAGLSGDGIAKPLGIFNMVGINEVTSVGTPADYVKVTNAIGKILQANYPHEGLENLSWVAHPRDWESYDSLTDTTDQPLLPTPWASKPRRLSTTSIDTTLGGGAESQMVIGDFREVLIGMRTSGVRIRIADDGIVTDAVSDTINATAHLMKFVIAVLRADIAVLRPTFFTKLTGVTVG